MPLELTAFESEQLLRVVRQVVDDISEGDHYGMTPAEIAAVKRAHGKLEDLAGHLIEPEDRPVIYGPRGR